MKKLFLAISIFVISGVIGYSQTAPPKDQQNVILKPKFVIGDFVFALQVLNSIEIKGSEVDAFLAVKNHFKPTVDKLAKENKQITDSMDVDVPLAVAQNMLSFLDRGKFNGSEAERYKRFVGAFQESAKALTPEKSGK